MKKEIATLIGRCHIFCVYYKQVSGVGVIEHILFVHKNCWHN